MSHTQTLDVAQLIDERPVTRFNVALVVFSFLIVLSDGYDITAIAFAAPELLKEWQITNRAALGPVFSASLVGILVGSPLLGYIGDRYGRKTDGRSRWQSYSIKLARRTSKPNRGFTGKRAPCGFGERIVQTTRRGLGTA